MDLTTVGIVFFVIMLVLRHAVLSVTQAGKAVSENKTAVTAITWAVNKWMR